MHRGFVRVYRKIVDGIVFSDPPAFHLFMYLLLMANHKSGYAYGQKVKEGQVLTGRKKLADAVAYSESGIEKIIKRLIKYGLLEQQAFNKYRVLTIVNYQKFTYAEQQSDNRVTTEGQQSNTNKHYKNDKNDKINTDFVPNENREVFKDWIEYKTARKEKYKTQKSIEACYKNLIKLSQESSCDPREIVNQSMANNYAGLFELKKGVNYGKATNRTQQSIDAGKAYIAKLERQESDSDTSGEIISITEFGT